MSTVFGYYPREYFASTTVSYVDIIAIDKNKVEINGSTFVDGVWYDKVVNSAKELIDFITKDKDNKRYKVLAMGNIVFDTSDNSQFPKVFMSNDIHGTFDIYHPRNNNGTFKLELNGTPGTATKISELINACHWYGFYTHVSLLFCDKALVHTQVPYTDSFSYLHINDCHLAFNTKNTSTNSKYYLGISDSSNVVYDAVDIPTSLFSGTNGQVDLTLTNCYNTIFNDRNSASKVSYTYAKLQFEFSDRCEANIYSNMARVSKQSGPGYNFVYNNAGVGAEAKFETPAFEYKAMPYR